MDTVNVILDCLNSVGDEVNTQTSAVSLSVPYLSSLVCLSKKDALCICHCRYQGCEPLILSCPSCSNTFTCPPLFSSICEMLSQRPTDSHAIPNFWIKMSCPKCPEEGDQGRMSPALLANQVICVSLLYLACFWKFWSRNLYILFCFHVGL